MVNADISDQTRVTDVPGDCFSIWSPNGNRISPTSCFPRGPEEGEERFGICDIYVVRSDGAKPINLTDNMADDRDPSRLTNLTDSAEADDSEPDWSPVPWED